MRLEFLRNQFFFPYAFAGAAYVFTRNQGGAFVRDAFPRNILPAERISRVARNMTAYIPAPNVAGDPYTRTNNFAAPGNMGRQRYDGWHAKTDVPRTFACTRRSIANRPSARHVPSTHHPRPYEH